jgi:hypothetical protein
MASLADLNLNQFLYRTSSTPDVNTVINSDGTTSTVSAVSGSSAISDNSDNSNETNPDTVVSGELAGNLVMLDGFIRSKNYVTNSSGWTINADGTAQLNNLTLTGGIIKFSKTSFSDATHAGYYISSEGLYIGAASDASKLKYTIADGSFDFIGTVSSRSTLTIANAINSSGQLITDIVNARLDSSAKTILSDFNFGTTNYAGAVKTGDIAWNTTTGGVTAGVFTVTGSGVAVCRNGIVGANSGVVKFSLDATTGNAFFEIGRAHV